MPTFNVTGKRNGLSHRGAIVGLALVLLAVGFGVAWNNGLHNRLFPKKFGVVEPGKLYRSGQIDRHLIDGVLTDHHIGVIVYMAADEPNKPDVAAEIAAAKTLGIERFNFPLNGKGVGDSKEYAFALAEIVKANAAGKPVLVHCAAGAQRTGGVTALYRLFIQHKSNDEVVNELVGYGHDPTANPELIPFLNAHMAEIADELVDLRVIDARPSLLPSITTN